MPEIHYEDGSYQKINSKGWLIGPRIWPEDLNRYQVNQRDQLGAHYDQNMILDQMMELLGKLENSADALVDTPGPSVPNSEARDLRSSVRELKRDVNEFLHPK